MQYTLSSALPLRATPLSLDTARQAVVEPAPDLLTPLARRASPGGTCPSCWPPSPIPAPAKGPGTPCPPSAPLR